METAQTSLDPHLAEPKRGLAILLLTFIAVIVLLESGGLLTWANRLEIGPLRQIALPVVTLLHEGLQPLGVDRLREQALIALDKSQNAAGAPAANVATTAAPPAAPDEKIGHQPTTAQPAQAQTAASQTAASQTAATAQTAPPRAANRPLPNIDSALLSPIVMPAKNAALPPLPPLPANRPRVVALVGDSMMAVGLGADLLRGMAGRDGLQAVRAFRSGTSLNRPEIYDWMTGYLQMIGDQQPDVVIVSIGANDGQGFVDNGKVIALGSDEWVQIYADRLMQFTDMLTRHGAQVIWVSLPPMRLAKFNDHIDLINRVAYWTASQNPHVYWLNSAHSIGDAEGHYREYTPGKGNRIIRLRAADGIHLSDEGAKLLSDPLLDWLEAAAPAPSTIRIPASAPRQAQSAPAPEHNPKPDKP